MVVAGAAPSGRGALRGGVGADRRRCCGLGGLAGQLVGDRRRAAALAAAGIGAGLLARMVADGADAWAGCTG